MRYMRLKWLSEMPDNKELRTYIQAMFGKIGLVESKFRVIDNLIACETGWVEKIQGALALKWQFKTEKISGTQKNAKRN